MSNIDPMLMRQIIMDHYDYPRNKELTKDNGYMSRHMASDSCIDDITVQTKISDGKIDDIRFDGVACTISTASTSIMSELLKGKTVQEAMEVTNKAVMEALDGLPPVKVHCSLLAEEAVHAALWDYAQKHHIEIEGLKKPKSDIHEGEEAEEEEY